MKWKSRLSAFLISAFIYSVIQGISVCYAEDNSEEYYKPYINLGLAAYYANIPDVAIKYLTVAINETPNYTNLITDDAAKVFYLRGLCYREELIRLSHFGGSKEEIYGCVKKVEEDMMVAAKSDKYKAWAYDSAGATWEFVAPCFEKLPPDGWDDWTMTPITKAPASRRRAEYFYDLAKDAGILSKKRHGNTLQPSFGGILKKTDFLQKNGRS